MRFRITRVGNTPCIALWGGESSRLGRQLQHVFDLSVAGLGLLLISPLLLVITLAVKLSSPGPILFLQVCEGLDGRRFQIFKFRTMRVMEAGYQPGLRQASGGDPRVTPVGRLLRRWSLKLDVKIPLRLRSGKANHPFQPPFQPSSNTSSATPCRASASAPSPTSTAFYLPI